MKTPTILALLLLTVGCAPQGDIPPVDPPVGAVQTGFAEFGQSRIYFEVAGEGRPVILIHGMASSLECWTFQKDALTEAGFAADLGAEKFFHIKCRTAGMAPSAIVLVVTRRAYLQHGIENVRKHVENLTLFGVPVAVCINRFLDDRDEDLREIAMACRDLGVPAEIADYREAGGKGGLELAERVVEACDQPSQFQLLYDLEASLAEKVEILATNIYGADDVDFSSEAKAQLKQITNLGYAGLPICVAKTPASLSDNPKLAGRPRGFNLSVSGARVSAGAGSSSVPRVAYPSRMAPSMAPGSGVDSIQARISRPAVASVNP